MSIIRLTKKFQFEMGHALHGHQGKCAGIHGHSYTLWVTVRGEVFQEEGHPMDGMVMDFAELKRIVSEHVVDRLDHALLLSRAYLDAQFAPGLELANLQIAPNNPTSENMLGEFARQIAASLPTGIELFSLRLQETPTSVAEWHQVDNAPVEIGGA